MVNKSKKSKTDLTCFVIMPFSDSNLLIKGRRTEIKKEEWDFIFKYWIKKAVESYSLPITCIRSATISGSFVKGIVKDLNTADFTIADLTDHKPNIFYELGIRHALRNGNIIITQDIKSIPTDLNSYYCFEYDYSDKTYEKDKYFIEFEKNIHFQIRAILENRFSPDNPVSDTIILTDYKVSKEQTSVQKISPEVFNALLRDSKNYSGLLKATSYYKDDFPWIFEFCTSLIPILKSKESKEKKIEVINDFLYDLKSTVKKPALKQLHSINNDLRSNYTRSYIHLKQYLEEIINNL